jgi:hypothetical protein
VPFRRNDFGSCWIGRSSTEPQSSFWSDVHDFLSSFFHGSPTEPPRYVPFVEKALRRASRDVWQFASERSRDSSYWESCASPYADRSNRHAVVQ